MKTRASRPIPRAWLPAIALAVAVSGLLSSAAHAAPFDIQGVYTCRFAGIENLQIASPRASTTWASAEGEMDLEVTGNQVEIFHLRVVGSPGSSLAFTLDPTVPAIGPLRPLISSFEVTLGLHVAQGAAGVPAEAPGWFLASFVAGGIAGTLGGQLPASPPGTRFALDMACVPAPRAAVVSGAFTRINEAKDRLCSIIELTNRELARFDPNSDQITLPAPCDAPPAVSCTQASCMCLCIGFDDCADLVVSDSCQPFAELKCNSLGSVSCTCPLQDCVLGPEGPDI